MKSISEQLALLFVGLAFTGPVSASPNVDGVLFTASIGTLTDTENYAGFNNAATDEYDSGIDAPEPPAPLGEYVRLAFDPMPGAPNDYAAFRTDWRRPPALPLSHTNGWTFTVSTNLDSGVVQLTAELGSLMDPSVPVLLWNGGRFLDLHHESVLSWSVEETPVRELILYIGTPGLPRVILDTPSADTVLNPGELFDVKWSVASALRIDRTEVNVSLDGGHTYSALAEADSLFTTVQWTTPDTGVSDGHVKVTVADSLGQSSYDARRFQVLNPESFLTGIHILNPVANSVLHAGDVVPVCWEWIGGSANVVGADVEVSWNEGTNWSLVTSIQDTSNEAAWTIPEDVFTRDARLRVRARVSVGVACADSVELLTVRPELIQNRSYEEWTLFGMINGPPDDWLVSTDEATVHPTVTSGCVKEGSMAAQIDLNTATSVSLLQEITNIQPGNRYTFSCFILDNSPAISASLRISALNASGALLTAMGSPSTVDNSSYQDNSVSITLPVGSTDLRLEIVVEASLAGTIFVDDVRLNGVEPDPEVVLIGVPADTVFTYDGVSEFPITWSYGESRWVVTRAMIDASFDDGSQWTPIALFENSTDTTFSWTGADTFSVQGRIRVTVENSSGAQTRAVSPRFYIRPSARQVVVSSGWHLFSLPLVPADPSVSAVLGNDISGSFWVYQWSGNGYSVTDTLRPFQGYWLALDQPASIHLRGDASVSPAQVDLLPGWTLIMNPFPRSLMVDSLLFRQNQTMKTFSEARRSGWITSTLYGFEPGSGSYLQTREGETLEPFEAYWLGVPDDSVSLFVNPPTGTMPLLSSTFTSEAQSEGDSIWSAPIVLRSNRGVNRMTSIGFMEAASSFFDPGIDQSAPPDNPDGSDVRLLILVNGPAPLTGQWLYEEYRCFLQEGEQESWPFILEAGEETRVDLDFRELVDVLPDRITAILDVGDNHYNLSESSLITWLQSDDPGTMLLTLAKNPAEETLPELPSNFAVSAPWPNPFNRSVSLHVSLPEPTVVTLEVVDVLGRYIEEREYGMLSAGQVRIVWAPSVASGVYYLRVRTDHGHQAVRRVVLIR